MTALSTCQAPLLGRISKPSIELSSKHESAPIRRKQYTWLTTGTKRKQNNDATEQSSDLTSHLNLFKKPKLHSPHTSQPISSAKVTTAPQLFQSLTPITKADPERSKPKLSLVIHNISQPVRTLITLHKFFLKALSIHYAHNGVHAPAELGSVLETITKLWKERSVTLLDIQTILAIYEISADVGPCKGEEVAHSTSPFKLLTAGSCIYVEYVGQRKTVGGPMSTLFDEKDLNNLYATHIYALDSACTKERHTHLSFFEDDTLDSFPKLACEIGTQTAAHKAHASQQLAEILTLSNAAQLRNTKIPTADRTTESLSNAIAVVERRKQNLLDRIKAKELASKTHNKPTLHQILRKHALGRIEEVTDILRMMQQQQNPESKSQIHTHTSTDFTSTAKQSAKVSFSLTQLKGNIKSSVRVPISDEEVTMCLEILSQELEGGWVRIVERKGGMSHAIFVVVEGEGISGREVQRRLMGTEV